MPNGAYIFTPKIKHKCKRMNIEYGGKHVCIIQYPSKEPAHCLSLKGHMNISIFVRGRVDIIRWIVCASEAA